MAVQELTDSDANVRYAAIADGEVFYVLPHLNYVSDGFMAWNKLE